MSETNLSSEQIDAGLVAPGFRLGTGQFTWSLPTAASIWPSYGPGEEPFTGYSMLSAAQGAAFGAAIAAWDELIAPNFTEVADNASTRGELRIAFTREDADTAAYAYSGTPQPAGGPVGDIWVNNDMTGEDFARGTPDFEVLLHEIGHTLGLKHSFEAPALPGSYDNSRYTVMSYTNFAHGGVISFAMVGSSIRATFTDPDALTPMVADIAAAQSIYGADPTTRAGDTVYRFAQDSTDIQAIYDAGGIDTIDLSNLTRASSIDLRPGNYSSVALYSQNEQIADWTAKFPQFASFIAAQFNGASTFTHQDNLGIAFSTIIENVIGSDRGETIVGNAAANMLRGNGGDDTLQGLDGDDRIEGGAGNDTLTGDGGADLFVFAGSGLGADVILAFDYGSDRFDLGGRLFTAASLIGPDTQLGYAGGTVTVRGAAAHTLAEWNTQVLGAELPVAVPIAITPAADARFVPVGANVTMLFAGTVTRGSGTITLARADGTVVESFDAATSTHVTIDGAMVVVDPSAPLAFGTAYTLSIAAGALRVDGVASSGLSGYGFATMAATASVDQFILAATRGVAAQAFGTGQVVGDAGVQDVTVLDHGGRIAFDGSFNLGGDRIHLAGDAAQWSVVRSGSSVQLSDGDTIVSVPVGTGGADLIFADGVRTLAFDAGAQAFRIGGQIVTASAVPVTAAAGAPVATGAIDPAAKALYALLAHPASIDPGATVTAGGVADVAGTSSADRVTVLPGAQLVFDGSFNLGGDRIVLPGDAADYAAVRSGSTLVLSSASESLRIPVGIMPTYLLFADGERALVFDSASGVTIGGRTIGTTAAALDASTFTTASLDRDDDANLATLFVTGADGNVHFTDDPDKAQNVKLFGFGRGDEIALTGDPSSYLFAAEAGTVTISHMGADGKLSTIALAGIADPTMFVNSAASAEAAAGWDFVHFV